MIRPDKLLQLQQDSMNRQKWLLRVFIVGGGFQYINMFYEAGLKGTRSVEDADIICFTGGEDVDPELYGQEALKGTHFNRRRDDYESCIYGEALALRKPMIGICRGAQFLNVMNGGSLWQDVNNHTGGKHSVKDVKTGLIVDNMTSTHHQQMRAADDAEVLAVACMSTHKKSALEELTRPNPDFDDVEALWYEHSRCLCFQPHPEFAHGSCRDYFLKLFDEYTIPAT